jgi:hypothetical protein
MQESQDYSGIGFSYSAWRSAGTLVRYDNLDHVIKFRRPQPLKFYNSFHSFKFRHTAIKDARDSNHGANID